MIDTNFNLLSFKDVVESTSKFTGKEYIRLLVKKLSEAMDITYVLITELSDDKRRVKTQAFYGNGEYLEDIEYTLKDNPCEDVLNYDDRIYFIPDHVVEIYPRADNLCKAMARGFLGITIKDDEGSIIGHLAAFDARPIPDTPEYRAIFRVFADRAGAELLRMKYEKKLLENEKRLLETNLNLEVLVGKRTEELQLANKELDHFLYRSSHDLKGPVSRMKGLLNLLNLQGGNEYIDRIGFEVDTIYQIISKLEKVAYISNDTLTNELINFPRMLRHIEKKFNLEGGNIQFRSTLNVNEVYLANPGLLNIILSNLLSNAIKFTGDKDVKKINLDITSEDKNIIIEIEDNGDGVPSGFEDRVFEMFFRASERDGIGLGLYLVRLAVNRLGGVISLESVYQKYTKVMISLPALSVGYDNVIKKRSIEKPVAMVS